MAGDGELMNSGDSVESKVEHYEDEAKRLHKEIELMKKNVENSTLYPEIRYELENNETLKKQISRVLGSHSHVQLVIYALGSIECFFNSQFQLALILLLKRDFSNWIGDVQVYDPLMSPADIIVYKELGFEVLTVDEKCKRKAERPTMFYLPHPNFDLVGNLLGANWSPSCINQIILLTNSLADLCSFLQEHTDRFGETRQRVERIMEFTTAIDIEKSYEERFLNRFFEFAWHFFDVDPDMDMETSLPVTEREGKPSSKPGHSWLNVQRIFEEYHREHTQSNEVTKSSCEFAPFYGVYRGPRSLTCNSVPPPSGWNKLNIYGIGTKGDQPGVYSGIFQDETGTRFGGYRGSIDDEDDVLAGLEALRHGLIRFLEDNSNGQKLIVESDNLLLVQYVNERPEPNEETMYRLQEILDLRDRATCLIYHVYEEVNEAARDWATRL